MRKIIWLAQHLFFLIFSIKKMSTQDKAHDRKRWINTQEKSMTMTMTINYFTFFFLRKNRLHASFQLHDMWYRLMYEISYYSLFKSSWFISDIDTTRCTFNKALRFGVTSFSCSHTLLLCHSHQFHLAVISTHLTCLT